MLKRRERELGFFTLQSFSQDDSVPLGVFRKVLCVSEAPTLVIAVCCKLLPTVTLLG